MASHAAAGPAAPRIWRTNAEWAEVGLFPERSWETCLVTSATEALALLDRGLEPDCIILPMRWPEEGGVLGYERPVLTRNGPVGDRRELREDDMAGRSERERGESGRSFEGVREVHNQLRVSRGEPVGEQGQATSAGQQLTSART